MDRTTLRLLFRLSTTVVVLMFTAVALLIGTDLPLSRAGRGAPALALLGSVVAIVLIIARLGARRHPGSSSTPLMPLTLVQRAIPATRERAESSRAHFDAARHRRRRAGRVRQAEHAALEAAADNEDLAPTRITASADALFRLVYLAWDARDPKRLATLIGPELLRSWERALDANDAAGVHSRAQVVGDVSIELVGLSQDATGAATTIVLIEAELSAGTDDLDKRRPSSDDGSSPVQRLCQYWTLTRDDPMTVQAIEEQAAGDHHLTEPILAGAVR